MSTVRSIRLEEERFEFREERVAAGVTIEL